MTDLPTDWIDNIGMSEDAAFLNAVGAAVNENTHARPESGLFSALPAAGNQDKLYYATDAGIVLQDNGTSWDVVGAGEPAFTAPLTAGWSNTSLGSAVINADKGGRLLTAPSATNTPLIEYRTLSPTSNYTFTARMDMAAKYVGIGGASYGGIFLRDSVSGNSVFFGYVFTLNHVYLLASRATTNIRASDYEKIASPEPGIPKWIRFRDDATNRYFEYSYNGLDWLELVSSDRTNHITPDQYGWGGANNSTSNDINVRLRSLLIS